MGKPFLTVLDIASAKLGREARNGADFDEVGLPIMGGCEVCGATVAAYNACPTRTGYLRCASGCVDDLGFRTVAGFDGWAAEQAAAEDDCDGVACEQEAR